METNGSTMKRLLNKNNDGKQIKLDVHILVDSEVP